MAISQVVAQLEDAHARTGAVDRRVVEIWRTVMEDPGATIDALREISRAAYHTRAALADLRDFINRRDAIEAVLSGAADTALLPAKVARIDEVRREMEGVRTNLDAVMSDIMTFAALAAEHERSIKDGREPLDETLAEAQAAVERAGGSLDEHQRRLQSWPPKLIDGEPPDDK